MSIVLAYLSTSQDVMRKKVLNPDMGNDLSFQPFVVETLGGWTQVADEIIDKIAIAQSYYQEIPYKKLACSIRRKITTSLPKDLCTMWFSSLCVQVFNYVHQVFKRNNQ